MSHENRNPSGVPYLVSRVSFAHDGLDRSYLLYLPPVSNPPPIVMMLHGTGGSADFSAVETRWSDLAAAERFAVVYPEGIAVQPDQPAKFLTNPQEWNDGSGHGRHDDVGFLSAVLDRLAEIIDPHRIFVTGFSNGAGMAFRFAAECAERTAALAPVAGHCWLPDPKLARSVPTFYLVGDSDPLAPLAGGTVRTPWGKDDERPPVGETLRRWASAIGQPASSESFPVHIIPGHGHHWPGGRALLGERLGGPAVAEVDATTEIWRFFRQHRVE